MTFICILFIKSRTIELRVHSEASESWGWSIGFIDGEQVSTGTSSNKLAAQLTAQRVFERRLQRAGLRLAAGAGGYLWREFSN